MREKPVLSSSGVEVKKLVMGGWKRRFLNESFAVDAMAILNEECGVATARVDVQLKKIRSPR